MTVSKLIDSSIWIAYLINGSFKEIIEGSEILSLSVLSLFEIKKILMKQGIPIEKIAKSLSFIKERGLLIDINTKISELAVDLSNQHKLPAIDALIYASALKQNTVLATLDNDFRGLKNVIVLD